MTPSPPATTYGTATASSACIFEAEWADEVSREFQRIQTEVRERKRLARERKRRERAAELRTKRRAAAARRPTYVSESQVQPPKIAPQAVKAAIEAADEIATTPYVWGGGHESFESSGYDCSGAVSYALHGAGLLDTPLVSGGLESYGAPGPGRWITIYANADHAYAVIAGLRWDTVGSGPGVGPRWHDESPYPDGFVVRHPPHY
jgi:cell wall-associated NlpC family hydrolase